MAKKKNQTTQYGKRDKWILMFQTAIYQEHEKAHLGSCRAGNLGETFEGKWQADTTYERNPHYSSADMKKQFLRRRINRYLDTIKRRNRNTWKVLGRVTNKWREKHPFGTSKPDLLTKSVFETLRWKNTGISTPHRGRNHPVDHDLKHCAQFFRRQTWGRSYGGGCGFPSDDEAETIHLKERTTKMKKQT